MFPQNVEKIQIAVERGFNVFSAAVITFMMLLTSIDVVLRYVFNSPIPGVYTLVEMLILGAVFPAIAYVQQVRGMVRVDVFIDRLKGSPRTAFELATLFLALVAFALLCWQIGILAWEAWITGNYEMGIIEWPFWPPMTVMTIGLGLLCLRFVTDIKNYLIELRKNSSHWRLFLIFSLLPLAAFAVFLGLVKPGQFDPMTIGWIVLAAMIVVLLMGLPVAFGLLLVGAVGAWVLSGPAKTLSLLGIVPYDRISYYPLSVVPLFILMGHLAHQAGFASSMYDTVQKWVGHIPGSMAQATVLGGAAFGAACGAGIASCATLGKVCIPVMRKYGVDDKMALGCVAATGGLAALIPPSIVAVIIALITDQSVGKLLIAGILPGLVAAGCFMALIYIRVKLNPKLAPMTLMGITWKQRVVSLKGTWGIGMLAIIVIGGIYAGVFTPTEAGALGAFGAFFLGLITKRLTMQNFKEAIMESTKTTAMIMLIIGTAMVFGVFLGISRIPANMSDYLMALKVPRLVVLIGVIIMYIIAGMFMDMIAFCFLTLPIIYPAVVAFGYDPIWFGIVVEVLCELALITPPFGLNLFILRGMIPGVTMGDVIRGSFPFMFMYLVTVILMIIFPGLATWLPSMM
jgi:tripartite ATP-independent transporter DctM subunit